MVTNMTNKLLVDSPAYMTVSQINIGGQGGQRLMVVYRTIGCEYDKKGTGCTMCDFAFYADSRTTDENVKKQHNQSLEKIKSSDFIHFDLLTLGNFYNDREISSELRAHLLTSLAKINGIKRVLTESRRLYVTPAKLMDAKQCLRGDQILEYALGYETLNPELRNKVLRKGTLEQHLDESLQMCLETGTNFVAYVLIKPQTLTEAEGIDEAVRTAVHVLQKADQYGVKSRIAFEPVFITRKLEDIWARGEYRPPKLWSVAEVLIQTAEKLGMENTEGKLFVGLSDENLSDGRFTSNSCSCDKEVREEIQSFNSHQDVSKLKILYHECKDGWEMEIGKI